MKITKTITTEFEFDYDAEVKRLTDIFQGDQLQRQLSILNHFKNGDYGKMMDEYIALPDEYERCPEREFVGNWYDVLFYGGNEYWPTHSFMMTHKKQTINNGTADVNFIIFGEVDVDK